jgi:hypothetical protein
LATDPEASVRFPAVPEKKIVGLERGALSLVSTTEELLYRKVSATVYKIENTALIEFHKTSRNEVGSRDNVTIKLLSIFVFVQEIPLSYPVLENDCPG